MSRSSMPIPIVRLGVPGDSPSAGSMNEQLTQRLLATLTPVVGAERVRASVNVEHDPSTLEESQERYDPAATVTLSMQRSEEMIGGAGVGGVPGTSSNVPGASAGANPSATTGDNNQNTKSETVPPTGSIKLFDAHRSPRAEYAALQPLCSWTIWWKRSRRTANRWRRAGNGQPRN